MRVVAVVLLLLAPQESAVRLRAGQEKLKVRDFDGAIPEFEKCLQLNPEEFNAHFGLGICWWEKDEYRKARDCFTKVVEIVEKRTPGSVLPAVRQKLLGCALLLEEFDAAIHEATILVENQAMGEYYFARALAKQRKGDVKGALEDGAKALGEEPRMTKARSLRASVLMSQGETKGALDEMAAAIQARPSDPSAYLARACLHYQAGDWNGALGDLASAGKHHKGQNSDLEAQAHAAVLTWLCKERAGPKSGKDVAAAFVKLLKELQKSPAKNHLLTLPAYLAGDETEAGLLKAAEEAPGRKAQVRCETWFYIGERKLLAGDKAGAREAFTKAVDTGVRGVFEHDLARTRLKSLGD